MFVLSKGSETSEGNILILGFRLTNAMAKYAAPAVTSYTKGNAIVSNGGKNLWTNVDKKVSGKFLFCPHLTKKCPHARIYAMYERREN